MGEIMADKKVKPFDEALFGELYQIFYDMGINPTNTQRERLRNNAERLAKLINNQNRLVTISLLNRVQNRVVEAFSAIEKKLEHTLNEIKKSSIPKKKEVKGDKAWDLSSEE